MAKILYIDDDEGLGRLVRRAMQRRGQSVETATSGPAGLDRLRHEHFELVAVDHYMPGMDGLETLAAIQALPNGPPVVYVTGSDEGQVAVAALKAGAADYIVKSTDHNFFDLLQSTFAQVLERNRLLREKAETERQLKASHERLVALLHEANHRVANSLQIVSAFVRLQASTSTSEETRMVLISTQQRIAAVAQVHRCLYSSGNGGLVDMAEYLRVLLAEIELTWSSPASPCTIELDVDGILLSKENAVSMGVVVGELVTNGFKYAYAPGTGGPIRVDLRAGDPGFVLQVEDDGRGFDPAETPKGTGTGTKLIQAMAASLGCSLQYQSGEGGCRVVLRRQFDSLP